MKNSFYMPLSKRLKRILLMFICIIILNSLISITTGFNFIQTGITKFLDILEVREEVREVTINSNGYSDETPGSFTVSKNFEWVDKNTINLNYDFDSYSKDQNKPKDILLVMGITDTITSTNFKKSAREFAANILGKSSGNRMAVLGSMSSFSDNAKQVNEGINSLNIVQGYDRTDDHFQNLVDIDNFIYNELKTKIEDYYNEIRDPDITTKLNDAISTELQTKLDNAIKNKVEALIEYNSKKINNSAILTYTNNTNRSMFNTYINRTIETNLKKIANDEIANLVPELSASSHNVSVTLRNATILEFLNSNFKDSLNDTLSSYNVETPSDTEIDDLLKEISTEIANNFTSNYDSNELYMNVYNKIYTSLKNSVTNYIDNRVISNINSYAESNIRSLIYGNIKNAYVSQTNIIQSEEWIKNSLDNKITSFVAEYKTDNPEYTIEELEKALISSLNSHIELNIIPNIVTDLENFTNSTIKDVLDSNMNTIITNTESNVKSYYNNTSNYSSMITNFKNYAVTNSTNEVVKIINDYLYAFAKKEICTKNTDRDIIVIYETHTYIQDSQNIQNQYKVLKDTYPNLTINMIQYNLGDDYIESIRKVSDNQIIANENTFSKSLYIAAENPEHYEIFELEDYLSTDGFAISKIKIPFGTANYDKESRKINWNFDTNDIRTGINAKMVVTLTIQEKLLEKNAKIYNINEYKNDEKWNIQSKLQDSVISTYSDDKPLAIQTSFYVKYDTNVPSCTKETAKILSSTLYNPFDRVDKSSEKLNSVCNGYDFQGWEITDADNDVSVINANSFIMPDHDVTIKAVWTKLEVNKSFQGTLYSVPTLWETIEAVDKANKTPSLKKLDGNDDELPIFYYTSDTNSNVIFGNYCWQIIRTTETGGIKLLYNGPTKLGDTGRKICTNDSPSTKTLSISKFNNMNEGTTQGKIRDTINASGYMLNTNNNYGITTGWTSQLTFGSDVTYSNGVYTLTNPSTVNMANSTDKSINDTVKDKHYTCLNASTSCPTVYYMTWADKSNGSLYSYMALTEGKTIKDALALSIGAHEEYAETLGVFDKTSPNYLNKSDSTIKSTIDNWYKNNLTNYTKYLEDTIWCNNRSLNSTLGSSDISNGNLSFVNPNGGSVLENDGGGFDNRMYYNTYFGLNNINRDSLTCQRKIDSFTVNETENGNGDLTYPIGLLTMEEVKLVGDSAVILNSNDGFWTMTPRALHGLANWIYLARENRQTNDGSYLSYQSNASNSNFYARPAISLKPGIKYTDGNGTKQAPYIIEYS